MIAEVDAALEEIGLDPAAYTAPACRTSCRPSRRDAAVDDGANTALDVLASGIVAIFAGLLMGEFSSDLARP